MNYISTKLAAQKWNISDRRVRALCKQGRIPGVIRERGVYRIPESAVKPQDGRLSVHGDFLYNKNDGESQEKQSYTVRETDDFFALSSFCKENGLGVQVENEKPDHVLKMWCMEDAQTGRVLAAVTLEMRGGVYVLGDIAVQTSLRGRGYGRVLQQTVFEQARRMGIDTIWACAKEPEYYMRHKWETVDWDNGPDIDLYCKTCSKKGVTCHPKKMKKCL